MADLLAGTTILAQDFPPTAHAEDNSAQSNITSTSYAAGSPEVGTTFTAPTTGRVEVTVFGLLRGDGTFQVYLSSEVYEGSDSTGTLVASTSDLYAAREESSAQSTHVVTRPVTGLTPGATHYVRLMHRVQGGTTNDVLLRTVTVDPKS